MLDKDAGQDLEVEVVEEDEEGDAEETSDGGEEGDAVGLELEDDDDGGEEGDVVGLELDDDDGKEEKYCGVLSNPTLKAFPLGGSHEQAPLSCSRSQHIHPELAPQSVTPVMPVRLSSVR